MFIRPFLFLVFLGEAAAAAALAAIYAAIVACFF